MTIFSIIITFVWYIIQGVFNSLGYLNYHKSQLFVAFIQALLVILFIEDLISHIIIAFVLICIACNILSFQTNFKYKDIHLYTAISSYLFVGLVWWDVSLSGILSVYPAMIIQKGLINIGSRLPFFSMITDDPTGKTYSIPLLGIKIPREPLWVRLVLAIISLTLIAIFIHFNLSVPSAKQLFFKIF